MRPYPVWETTRLKGDGNCQPSRGCNKHHREKTARRRPSVPKYGIGGFSCHNGRGRKKAPRSGVIRRDGKQKRNN